MNECVACSQPTVGDSMYCVKCSNPKDEYERKVHQAFQLWYYFKQEYEATKNVVREGDPFLMTRTEYLSVLENIWNKSHVYQSPQESSK